MNAHVKEVSTIPSAHHNRKQRIYKFAATLVEKKKNRDARFLIGWTKDEMQDREQGTSRIVALHRAPAARPRAVRYLLQNDRGEVLLLHEHAKASRFTRSEVNQILLAFYNAGSLAWNAPGLEFFPIVMEDLSK